MHAPFQTIVEKKATQAEGSVVLVEATSKATFVTAVKKCCA